MNIYAHMVAKCRRWYWIIFGESIFGGPVEAQVGLAGIENWPTYIGCG
jgi:hypothetical protein